MTTVKPRIPPRQFLIVYGLSLLAVLFAAACIVAYLPSIGYSIRDVYVWLPLAIWCVVVAIGAFFETRHSMRLEQSCYQQGRDSVDEDLRRVHR